MSGVVLNSKFKEIYHTTKRYILLTGGRGSAKSFHTGVFLAQLTMQAGHRILFTRYTMASAKDSIIPEFQEKIELLGWENNFQINARDIVNLGNGSDIMFRGIKRSSGRSTANLKSLQGVTTVAYEEMEEMDDEDEFNKIDLSVRKKGLQNRVVMIMNPPTTEHFVWKRWFIGHTYYIEIEGQSIAMTNHPDVLHIHTTYLDNLDNLSHEFLKAVAHMKKTNFEGYVHVMLGSWMERAKGAIFTNWSIGKFDESLPAVMGMDFGFAMSPDTLVRVAIDQRRKKLYAKELMYAKGQSRDALIANLKRIIKNKNELIIADSEDARLIQDLQDAGLNVVGAKKGPGSVLAGIKRLQDYEMIIDQDSPNLQTELNNYRWHDTRAEVPIKLYDHLIDPIRYCEAEINSVGGASIIW